MKDLTAGAFARLCGTKKDTILYYDREGLLKPRYVSENGYRRYGVEQYYDFDMIVTLKETGSSLKEIREHMSRKNPSEFLAVLEEKRILLRRERERIVQREAMLDTIINLSREAMDAAYDRLVFQHQEEEHLEFFSNAEADVESEYDYINVFADWGAYFESQNRIPPQPFGAVASREGAEAGLFIVQYFFCKAVRATPQKMRHTKPKGEYAVWMHRGTGRTHEEAFARLLAEVKKTGRTISGPAYAYEMMTYIVVGNVKEYIVKYCVQVD